jgi:hypothetical protein
LRQRQPDYLRLGKTFLITIVLRACPKRPARAGLQIFFATGSEAGDALRPKQKKRTYAAAAFFLEDI